MHRLEGRIGFVLGVTGAVVIKGSDLVAEVFAHPFVDAAVFIDVVPEMEDQIQILLQHVFEGGVKAGLVVLAAGKGEPQPRCHHPGGRQGAGAGFGADFRAGFELIPIPAVRLQS